MTRRERLERKLEKREQWAQGREAAAAAEFEKNRRITSAWVPGQPILVGHHSEKRARREHDRAWDAIGRAVENSNMADHHRSKAAGLADQLEHTIFSDDTDAVEQLEKKIAELEKKQAFMVAANKICRNKRYTDEEKAVQLRLLVPELKDSTINEMLHPSHAWNSVGFESYELTNNNANIRRYKERLAVVKIRQARQEKVAESESGVMIEGGEYVVITFAEKPEREIITALKEAGFYWSGGSWRGKRANIPPALNQ